VANDYTGPRISGWPYRPKRRAGGARSAGLGEREEALSAVPLFAGLPKRGLRALARISALADKPKGAEVVKEGAKGSAFFAILEGKVRVVRRGRTVARLGPGDFFGEMSLFDDTPRTASVLTEEPSRFLTLSGKELAGILQEDGRLAMAVLRTMARRLREAERPPAG
jgi:CRP/FNR family cyclic AMP-dependent transcriptional regulator